MAHRMNEAEVHAFLAEEKRTATVCTTRADGRPHVAPVWFVLDGADVLFTTGAQSVKGRTLRRDPRVSLCVDDESGNFSFVIIEGTATLSEEPAALLRWATAIGARYMGADHAEAFGKRNGAAGELLVRVTPTKVTSLVGAAD